MSYIKERVNQRERDRQKEREHMKVHVCLKRGIGEVKCHCAGGISFDDERTRRLKLGD